MILFDRSRVTEDWRCPRARYLKYDYNDKGLTSDQTSLELAMGTVTHSGLAAFALLGDKVNIDELVNTAWMEMFEVINPQHEQGELQDFAKEQATLVEGMLRGFYKHVWPRLMVEYPKIIAVEQEMVYEYAGMKFMSKPDLIVEDHEGNWFYIEYKTTSSKKESWINSWETAVQLHSSIKAVEQTLKHEVTGVIVQGLYKGYDSGYGQNSPFCYGYHRSGQPPFVKEETIYAYKAGFKRYPTWEMQGGIKQWVEGMPTSILADQFPCTPTIFVNNDLIDAWLKQREFREKEIDLAKQMLKMADEESRQGILNVAFPQRFDQCQPAWGHGCEFRNICHGSMGNPLEHGYRYRTPHHSTELEALNDE